MKPAIAARARAALVLLGLSATAACGPADVPGPAHALPACEGGTFDPGPAPLRRLTHAEYNQTVADLLGVDLRPADAFVTDAEALGFSNQAAALSTSALAVEQWREAAEALAEAGVDTLLDGLPACGAPTEDATACAAAAREALAAYGQRAFRRPLEAQEVDAHGALFHAAATLDGAFDAREGVRAVMEALLQSPHFLYRVEFGRGEPIAGDVVELTSWEVAVRLSYLLWGTMPDDRLFGLAAQDALRTDAQVEAEARRMILAPQARRSVTEFHREWLDLAHLSRVATVGRDPGVYPDYNDALLPLWQQEAEAFVDQVVFEDEAPLDALFTAPYSMMNAPLAAFYGVDGPATEAFGRVELDGTRYAGLLTQAGLLALHAAPTRSSPTHRGRFVREALLCQALPPPPDDVPPPPVVDPTKTTREQFAEHTASASCSGCHRLMDPIGIGFEHFDGIGRYRADEHGLPIDARGEIVSGGDASGAFEGVVELGHRLAASDTVRDCVATQWFRYAYGRAETPADTCSASYVRRAFAASGYDVQELLLALATAPSLRYRHTVSPTAGGSQ